MASVSILLPAYNAEYFLQECIDSIITQTYTDFDLIVCDDASTDKTPDILMEYAKKDCRIKILTNSVNLGIAKTRNRLLSALTSDHKFIAIMDADDVMFPDRLQRQIDYLANNDKIAAVGAALEIINEDSKIIGFRKYPESPHEIRKNILKANPISQSSLMLRKEVVETIGMYRIDMDVCEDYDYWLRALKKFDFVNLPQPVIRYRISSVQSKCKNLKLTLKNTLILNREYLFTKEYFSVSSICFFFVKSMLYILPTWLIMEIFFLSTYKKAGK